MALIAGAVGFTYLTGRSLPDVVASHFDGAGRASGYLPRTLYLVIMLVITASVPLLLVVIPNRALSRPDARINLPNRSYWLAPERRDETVRLLWQQMTIFAALVTLFLCYTQWLVVRANSRTPPSLDSQSFLVGLVVFLARTFSWVLQLLRRFRSSP
jgi:serine/threonine-protein kinase